MYCIKCGTKLNPEDKFCIKCGTRVKPVIGKQETSDRQTPAPRRQDDAVTSLVTRFMKDQDPEAFEKIYQAESSKVFARARMMLGNDADAQDILQDVFLSVYTKIGGLKNAGAFEGWLMTLTRNASLNQLSKSGRMTQFAVAEDGTSYQEEELENPYVDFKPESSMEQKELAENLKQIMDTLPAIQSICLQMREYDGLSYQEIADELSIPLSQVKNNIFHAKKKVKAEVIARKLYAAAPLAFFLWMLRQSTEVYACEASVADAVWTNISARTVPPASSAPSAPDTSSIRQKNDLAETGNPAETDNPVETNNLAEANNPEGTNMPTYNSMNSHSPVAQPQSAVATASKAVTVAKSAGIPLAVKILIAIVSAVALIGIGVVATLGIMKKMNKEPAAVQTETAGDTGEGNEDTDSGAGMEADAEQQAGTEDVSAAADEAKESTDDESEADAFEPVDYWDKLSEDQKTRLYSVLSSIYDTQEPEYHMTVDHEEILPTDMTTPILRTSKGLWNVAYSIVISPGFYDDYHFERKNRKFEGMQGEFNMAEIPKAEMDDLLKSVINMSIDDPESFYDQVKEEPQLLCNLYYENGNYIPFTLDDWVFGYAGLLRITQTGPDEVTIYGVTGLKEINGFEELNYDPLKWKYDPEYEGDLDIISLSHSYSALARINPDSPCGLTILGITYDDPESAKIAGEAGLVVSSAGATGSELFGDEQETKGYLLPSSDKQRIKEQDIEDMTAAQLRLARNEIYARHGRKFQDEELQAYFDSQPWYTGMIEPEDFNENMLNDVERENAEILKKEEEKKK